MARIVFVLLLVANLAVFVWSAGYLGGGDEGREPERLRQQLQPERMKVSLGGTPPEPVAAPAPASAPVVCRRVGPLDNAAAEPLAKAVSDQGGKAVVAPEEKPAYWVHIPAVGGKVAEKDVATLKKAGFRKFSVVDADGPDHNAISFGTFDKEDAAKEKIALLVRNGIKSAKIAPRTTPTGAVLLSLRGPAVALDKALAGQAAEQIDCPKE